MKIRSITICLLLCAMFFSCKKDDLSEVGSSNKYVPKLSKILVNNESSVEFQYNDSNMVKAEKSKFDYTAHHYNSAGQLISSDIYGNDDVLSNDNSVYQTAMSQTTWVSPSNGIKCGDITYEYNSDGLLVKAVSNRPQSQFSEFSEFSYDSDKRVIKQTLYWENVASGYVDYQYDSKGNLTSEMLYNITADGSAELISNLKYTYDNEPNPLKTLTATIPGIHTNTNNILKETLTIHVASDQPDKTEITENSYKYNALGYPISKNGNITYIY
jgi:hypothetical protein